MLSYDTVDTAVGMNTKCSAIRVRVLLLGSPQRMSTVNVGSRNGAGRRALGTTSANSTPPVSSPSAGPLLGGGTGDAGGELALELRDRDRYTVSTDEFVEQLDSQSAVYSRPDAAVSTFASISHWCRRAFRFICIRNTLIFSKQI